MERAAGIIRSRIELAQLLEGAQTARHGSRGEPESIPPPALKSGMNVKGAPERIILLINYASYESAP